MSKELPFFKFTPTEWLVGKISFQSLEIQGAFLQCCCMFWKLNGKMKPEDIDFRIGKHNLQHLIEYDFLKLTEGYLRIDFLEEQLETFEGIRNERSKAGVKSAESKAKQKATNVENKTTSVNGSSTSVQQNSTDIRHKTKEKEKDKEFNFKKELLALVQDKDLVNDYVSLRRQKKASLGKTAFELLVNECNQHNFPIQEALRIIIEKNWQGFKVEWVNNLNKNNPPPTKPGQLTEEALKQHQQINL